MSPATEIATAMLKLKILLLPTLLLAANTAAIVIKYLCKYASSSIFYKNS